MLYKSLNKIADKVSFEEAVIKGLAPDKGLYFPESITPLSDDFFQNIQNYTNEEIAYQAIKQFVGNEIPTEELKRIIKETIAFDFPVVEVEKDVYSLELYHGPTLAFKDVGARFMARCLGYFNTRKETEKVTVLVATSGDTGGAVADGFYKVKGVDVIILYPKGKVSLIQEKQLTTLGENIEALEVDGVFDDCQDMVKKAFLDEDLKHINLTSANSINVARWLPQMFYYFFAYKTLQAKGKEIVISVPSGNFGNICAGVIASKLGLPIQHFVASTNVNDTVPRYLQTGDYKPNPSKATISNAMDVSNPSNFIRIQELFGNDLKTIQSIFTSYSFSDSETKTTMVNVFTNQKYTLDPHGAVGYLGLKKYLSESNTNNVSGVFLETAHPIKFLDVVESTLGIPIAIPNNIKDILTKEKKALEINSYEQLKSFIKK